MAKIITKNVEELRLERLARLRELRDELLVETDWTQSIDVHMPAVLKESYADFREVLRRFPGVVESLPYDQLVLAKLPDTPEDVGVPLYILARKTYQVALGYLADGKFHLPAGSGGDKPLAWLDTVKAAALWWVNTQGKYLFHIYEFMIKETQAAEEAGLDLPYGQTSQALQAILDSGKKGLAETVSAIKSFTTVADINNLFQSFLPDPMKNWMVTEVWAPFPEVSPWGT